VHSLTTPFRALVIGASGTIGSAFVSALAADPGCERVSTVSRSTHAGFDLEDAEGLTRHIEQIGAGGPYSLVIDATGVLAVDPSGPEKSLGAIVPESMQQMMQFNAIGPILMLRALLPHFAPGRCLYGKLSARVGSIADNRLGGWYGYRASKAALNMLLQTAAIEIHRRRPEMVIAALQPGTVRSALSERFIGSRTDLVDPIQSAQGLLAALDSLTPGSGASFIDWQGRPIPW
jgi:NAD(P)-dependent dehydrogenase (short-subunit alcohol dehydrogenase family)